MRPQKRLDGKIVEALLLRLAVVDQTLDSSYRPETVYLELFFDLDQAGAVRVAGQVLEYHFGKAGELWGHPGSRSPCHRLVLLGGFLRRWRFVGACTAGISFATGA